MKVLCLWHATNDELAGVKRALPAGTEVVAPSGDYLSRFECRLADVERDAVDADMFLGWVLPRGILKTAKKLQLLSWMHTDCDDLNLAALKQRGVRVANLDDPNSAALAEDAMMFVLALAKRTLGRHQLALASRKPVNGFDAPLESQNAMLEHRTMGVIGVGNIGARIARHAKAFDMHVLGVRRNKHQSVEHVDSMHGMDELHSVLPKCDYVVLTAPLTKDTHHFFGKPEIEAMKTSAFLVNISRGDLVQEKPLYEALTSGRLRGYAADAWPQYRIGEQFNHFWMPRFHIHGLPNVVCTLEGASLEAEGALQRYLEQGVQNLVEFANGMPLTNEISLDSDYAPR
ncbi:phosphoglycerate dehydrogenase-like enzyme [Bradyrhizobium sp. USDA 4011]